MNLNIQAIVEWVGRTMGEAHRGVLPFRGRLLAFGNRGQEEVEDFRAWLRDKRYTATDFGAADDTWVMVVEPPARMRDTRAVLTALWEASPDSPSRKALQWHIADVHVRLVFARQGQPLERSWFTKGECRQLAVLALLVADSLGLGVQADDTPDLMRSTSPRLLEPSLN